MKKSSSDLLVVASAKAKPGKESDLERALREVAQPTRSQPGCVEFQLFRLKGNNATIIGFERWASETDHQNHLKGAHVQLLMQKMADILAEPPNIAIYEIIDE